MSVKNPHSTLLGISSFQVLAMFRRGLFYTFLSIYLREFLGLTITETTLFATLPMTMNVGFQLFVWGKVSDAFQIRRTLIVLGELLAAAGTVLLWYVHTIPESKRAAAYVIIAGLSVIEIFWSMSNIGWSALISDIWPGRDRTAIQGQLFSIGGMGRIAGVWIGGILYDGLGMKFDGWGFQDGALFFVAAGAMVLSSVPLLFVGEGGVALEATDENGAKEEAAAVPGLFILFLIAMVFVNFGRNSIAVILGPYLSIDTGFGLASKDLSYVINARSVAMIVAGVFIGRMGRGVRGSGTLLAGTALAIVSLIVLACANRLYLIYISNIVAGCADIMIMSAGYTLASLLIPPERRGRLFAWYNATMFLSWGYASTLIAGPVIDTLMASGSSEVFAYRMAFLCAAGVTTIGVGILVYLVMRRGMAGAAGDPRGELE